MQCNIKHRTESARKNCHMCKTGNFRSSRNSNNYYEERRNAAREKMQEERLKREKREQELRAFEDNSFELMDNIRDNGVTSDNLNFGLNNHCITTLDKYGDPIPNNWSGRPFDTLNIFDLTADLNDSESNLDLSEELLHKKLIDTQEFGGIYLEKVDYDLDGSNPYFIISIEDYKDGKIKYFKKTGEHSSFYDDNDYDKVRCSFSDSKDFEEVQLRHEEVTIYKSTFE